MAVFNYIAFDNGTDNVTGTIAADTPRQARELLRERGLLVRDISDYRKTAPVTLSFPSRWRSTRAPRSAQHQATTFIRELSTLLGVGVPLLESLETIGRQHVGRFQTGILLLRDRVTAGSSLASAMAEQPAVFDELCVNITEVGEDSGTLDTSLERLAEFRERSEQLKGRLTTVLIYPAIVSVVALFSTLFLMTFVIPKILEPLIEQGLALPMPTRLVKGGSDLLVAWWWLLLLFAGGAGIIAGIVLRSTRGRIAWHRLILHLPLVGDLSKKQAIVRIAVVLSTLLKSGIVFVRAIQIAQRTTGNLVIRAALQRCETAINAGGDIGAALEQSAVFPPMVIQIFSLGQQSGRLEEMLDRLAAAYELQVSSATQRLAAVLEPVIIVLLALMVLFVVLATVLPILEVGNAMQ